MAMLLLTDILEFEHHKITDATNFAIDICTMDMDQSRADR